MALKGLDHFYVETLDFAPACAFWEALGFTLERTWGEGGHRAGRLVNGGTAIVLAVSPDPVDPTPHFRVTGAAALQESLAASDAVEITTPLEDTHWGTKWIRLRDPDGNTWVLEETGD